MPYISETLPKDHTIVATGDWHLGCKAADEDVVDKAIERVQDDERAYFLGMGDYIDAVRVDDPRFDPNSHVYDGGIDTPLAQIKLVEEKLDPISDSIIALLEGNHEKKKRVKDGGDLTKLLCENLNVDYGHYESVVSINRRYGQNGSNIGLAYNIFAWHGNGSVNSRVDSPRERRKNKLRSVRRKLRDAGPVNCDVYLMGHIHDLLHEEPEIMNMMYYTDNGIQARVAPPAPTQDDFGRYVPMEARWHGVTGTALRTKMEDYSTYSAVKGYDANPLGWLEIHVEDGNVVDLEEVYYDEL